jgi:hypothetical protein
LAGRTNGAALQRAALGGATASDDNMASFDASEPSLRPPPGAASLARVRAATGGAPPRVVGVRSSWWECKYPARACAFFACTKVGDGNAFVQAACCGLGILAGIFSLFFCVARRRERESFVVVVTEGDFAASREDKGWSCGDGEGTVIVQAGRARDVVKVQRHASLLWELGNQPCGDHYWCNCFWEGGFPCCDSVAVYLADPVTGQRKKEKCCGCECYAQPDYRWDCLKDARAVEDAIIQAHAHSGAGKFVDNGAVIVGAPPPGSIVMVSPLPLPMNHHAQGYYAQQGPPTQYATGGYAASSNYPMGYAASSAPAPPPPGYTM